jgi:hypothetical protein
MLVLTAVDILMDTSYVGGKSMSDCVIVWVSISRLVFQDPLVNITRVMIVGLNPGVA